MTADAGRLRSRLGASSRRRLVAETNAQAQPGTVREALSFEDRALLALHVERHLGFHEIAYFLGGAALGPTNAPGEAERLRKRFQLLEARLRQLAIERGLPTD